MKDLLKTEPSRRTALYAALCTLAFLLIGHAFCWFNIGYSGSGVALNPTVLRSEQISSGSWAQPLYWTLRGKLSAPMLVGLLSCLYLALTAVVAAQALHIRTRLTLTLLCGVLSLNACVTAINASQLHIADACFLALLLCVLGAALAGRGWPGAAAAAVLFGAGAALRAPMLSAGAALLVLIALRTLLEEERPRAALGVLGRGALALLAGAALHVAGYAVMTRRLGLDWQATLQGPLGAAQGGLAGAWLEPLRQLVQPMTAYRALGGVLGALLLAGGAALLILLLRGRGRGVCALAALLALGLPLAVNLPVFASEAPSTTAQTGAYWLLTAGVLMLFDLREKRQSLGRAAGVALGAGVGVLLLSAVIFSNQVYLKKNLEQQSTLSVMTRVLDRVERTEGYDPGVTPVALLGSLEDLPLAMNRAGFEPLADFDAAQNNFAATNQEELTWYMWEIMGYPCNLVSYYEAEMLALREDVQAMPVFPAEGSCQMIDGTIVVRLSGE
ncbi:MAG: hypothetical protein MSL26_11330 [Clostridiales bacterium]|nr:hypothetical protein [Clostridiales bacterium]